MLLASKNLTTVTVAILMKTGLNNVVRPTLFTVVNNIVTPDSGSTILFNIVNWQVWTMWAAQHCPILLNSRLIIFTRVDLSDKRNCLDTGTVFGHVLSANQVCPQNGIADTVHVLKSTEIYVQYIGKSVFWLVGRFFHMWFFLMFRTWLI